jgi:hypothetical protein
MSLSQAAIEHQQKIQRAKGHLEDNGGKTIKPEKIQDWALLEIAQTLSAIHFQLVQQGIARKFGAAAGQ